MGTQPYSALEAQTSDGGPSLNRRIIATVMLVALLALFLWAGFWQLERAEFKHEKQLAISEATLAPRVTQVVTDADAELYLYRQLQLSGRYLPERQVLLDNMTSGGVSGYEVITLFETAGRYVMVNRGWLAANPDRRVLPAVDVPGNTRTVSGQLQRLPAPGLILAAGAAAEEGWPRRLLFPDRDTLAETFGVPLPDYQILLNASDADGYSRQWVVEDDGPEQHLAYAVQWFAFAALAVIFYLILNVRWHRTTSHGSE